MTTPHVLRQLWAYHLAESDDRERFEVESHLFACRDCLAAYFELKRDLDLAATPGARPSPATRARIREAVAGGASCVRGGPARCAGRSPPPARRRSAVVVWSGHHRSIPPLAEFGLDRHGRRPARPLAALIFERNRS